MTRASLFLSRGAPSALVGELSLELVVARGLSSLPLLGPPLLVGEICLSAYQLHSHRVQLCSQLHLERGVINETGVHCREIGLVPGRPRYQLATTRGCGTWRRDSVLSLRAH